MTHTKSHNMTRAAQVDSFIKATLKEGKFTQEDLEDALVCMSLVKTHKEAKRRITQVKNRLKAQEACLLPLD